MARLALIEGNYFYNGCKIIINDTVGERKRSWKERLFTLPWNPFKRTAHDKKMVPDGKVLTMDIPGSILSHKTDKTLIMNSRTLKDLKESIQVDDYQHDRWNLDYGYVVKPEHHYMNVTTA